MCTPSAPAANRPGRTRISRWHLWLETKVARDARLGQLVWVEDLIDLVLGKNTSINNQLSNGLACANGLLGDVCGERVADIRRQRRRHRRRLLEQPGRALLVRFDPYDALARELAAA